MAPETGPFFFVRERTGYSRNQGVNGLLPYLTTQGIRDAIASTYQPATRDDPVGPRAPSNPKAEPLPVPCIAYGAGGAGRAAETSRAVCGGRRSLANGHRDHGRRLRRESTSPGAAVQSR